MIYKVFRTKTCEGRLIQEQEAGSWAYSDVNTAYRQLENLFNQKMEPCDRITQGSIYCQCDFDIKVVE